MSITEIKTLVEREPAVILYFRNDNCPPCIALRPKVEELIREDFPRMRLEILNAVDDPELGPSFKVFAHPTILVYFEGKEYLRKSKYVSMEELKDSIARYYRMMD